MNNQQQSFYQKQVHVFHPDTGARLVVSMSTSLAKFYLKIIIFLIIGLQSACSSNQPTVSTQHQKGLLLNQSIQIDSDIRTYHLYLPENSASAESVLLLHGRGGSKDQLMGLDGRVSPYKIWMDIALRENLILIVPDGSLSPAGRQGWNDCRSDASDNPDFNDVAFIRQLINSVNQTYGQSAKPVFVVGTSNGAHMAMRLADEVPEIFNGFAFIVGARAVNSECSISNQPTPVLMMNGTKDPLVPYDGGPIASNRGLVLSAADTISYWVNRNQITAAPVIRTLPDSDPDDQSTVRRLSYASNISNAPVMWFDIIGGGHTEPSKRERYTSLFKRIVGEQNGDIEMAEVIWTFFDSL